MKPFLASAALAFALSAAPGLAGLAVNAPAPDFTTQAALGGKEFTFSLKQALKKGPVVLYFYPKSFTSGCTIEAHDFAEATPQFAALKATVIGVSRDNIETQKKFSTEECRSAFAVAADADGKITDAYDAKLPLAPLSDRISYVIAPGNTVIFAYKAMSPDQHVAQTMAAVKKWDDAHKPAKP